MILFLRVLLVGSEGIQTCGDFRGPGVTYPHKDELRKVLNLGSRDLGLLVFCLGFYGVISRNLIANAWHHSAI